MRFGQMLGVHLGIAVDFMDVGRAALKPPVVFSGMDGLLRRRGVRGCEVRGVIMDRLLGTRTPIWICVLFFWLCGWGEARAAVLLTPYDEGHDNNVLYRVVHPISGTLLQGEVELVPTDPEFLTKPTDNFTNVLANAFPNWTFRYGFLFTGSDLTLSDNSLIVHEYSAIHDLEGVGANFIMEYEPHGDDPSGIDVHWIQVVQNNHRLGQPHGTPENIVDNNGVASPYYDVAFPFSADSTGFSDTPRRDDDWEDHSWTAELFLVQDEGPNGLGGRQVAVYDGLRWGWENTVHPVPEPSSCLMAGMWTVLGSLYAWRRRGSPATC